ncbi:hypothetical protein VE01_03334 [Pseudogymnoascus verrucosus]|uniref:Kinesin-like protein KIP2 n=1 Tax=Pseudogymnoascus verrucosus TaxID=342668 RepID=A0A1B8GS73_9PEZI|nr:uncharacterized protein VE01_03334 [Pseudogymnoascus verrucosus]OBT98683.1 hypothetical protein VE01_03334 [Pseudogymnoascus verrucosus]
MAASIPRPSRPSYGPPTSALPAIPTTKTRKSTGAIPTFADSNDLTIPLPKTGLRSPSGGPPETGLTLPKTLPKLRTLPAGTNSQGKTIRKTISINSFPQPPRSTRTSSLPPSPLSAGAGAASNRDSTESSPLTPLGAKPLRRKPKTSLGPGTQLAYAGGSSPSLLNGSGTTKSISSGPGARGSDGLLSLPSPPQSRSSSAQDTESTASTYEDGLDAGRGRQTSAELANGDSKSTEGKGNVIVSVRVRPDAGGDAPGASKTDGEWMVDGRRSLVAYKGPAGGDHYYDNVFATHDTNSRVYDGSAKRLVRRVMEGYHGTVFAYGMTGTGKTFSMQGTATNPGVIPLAITDIFSYIRETPSREFLLRVSYLEIYNEKIHDLLNPPPANALGANAPAQEEIKLREDAKRGVYASPLKEEIVQSPTQLLRVIARGDHARRTSSTQFNARSSRSHAVVQIVVESRERLPGNGAMSDNKRSGLVPGGVRVSTLSLIDLAGSERAAETKERREEGSHINKSLLTLGTVIARLSGDKDKEGKPMDKNGKHLPYRDSKLTRLLQGALSGDSLVSILCTIQIGSVGSAAAANTHTGETLNTLKFASRAKNNIVSHAKKAEEALGAGGDGGARVLLERYRLEIQDLRGQLDGQARSKDDEEESKREKEAELRHEEQMLEMQLARTALKERIEHLNRLIISSKSTGVNSGSFSSMGNHPRLSTMTSNTNLASARSSYAASLAADSRKSLERSPSMASQSTLGQLPASDKGGTGSSTPHHHDGHDDEDSMGEYGDGTASLAAQNRALLADVADKNRYISTLEKRLLQARRSSHSRASIGFNGGKSGAAAAAVAGGEDTGVAALLRDKDAEILDLRARLDDKDHMLTALRSAARSRDAAERSGETTGRTSVLTAENLASAAAALGRGEVGLGLGMGMGSAGNHVSIASAPTGAPLRTGAVTAPATPAAGAVVADPMAASMPTSPVLTSPTRGKGKRKSVDEMSRMLDEMIQDRVERGEIVKGVRGSVRLPGVGGERKEDGGVAVVA